MLIKYYYKSFIILYFKNMFFKLIEMHKNAQKNNCLHLKNYLYEIFFIYINFFSTILVSFSYISNNRFFQLQTIY